jgi:hypothetical protein
MQPLLKRVNAVCPLLCFLQPAFRSQDGAASWFLVHSHPLLSTPTHCCAACAPQDLGPEEQDAIATCIELLEQSRTVEELDGVDAKFK